jgi:hypothetical protein
VKKIIFTRRRGARGDPEEKLLPSLSREAQKICLPECKNDTKVVPMFWRSAPDISLRVFASPREKISYVLEAICGYPAHKGKAGILLFAATLILTPMRWSLRSGRALRGLVARGWATNDLI